MPKTAKQNEPLTFPYTMHCPACKKGLKVKNERMIGQLVPCPSCGKKITIVTPEEDGYVPYGVNYNAPPPPAPAVDAREEADRIAARDKRHAEQTRRVTKEVIGTLMIVFFLSGAIWLLYYMIVVRGPKQERVFTFSPPALTVDVPPA